MPLKMFCTKDFEWTAGLEARFFFLPSLDVAAASALADRARAGTRGSGLGEATLARRMRARLVVDSILKDQTMEEM